MEFYECDDFGYDARMKFYDFHDFHDSHMKLYDFTNSREP